MQVVIGSQIMANKMSVFYLTYATSILPSWFYRDTF